MRTQVFSRQRHKFTWHLLKVLERTHHTDQQIEYRPSTYRGFFTSLRNWGKSLLPMKHSPILYTQGEDPYSGYWLWWCYSQSPPFVGPRDQTPSPGQSPWHYSLTDDRQETMSSAEHSGGKGRWNSGNSTREDNVVDTCGICERKYVWSLWQSTAFISLAPVQRASVLIKGSPHLLGW